MKKCIYCLRDDTQTTFTRREHVVPSLLGRFRPLNPTLPPSEGLVCDECNHGTFSPLEAVFTEDSHEGVYAQRLLLGKRRSVVMRGQRYKISRISGFGDSFFDSMFLFLEPGEEQMQVVLRNQIKVKRHDGYRVFLVDTLEKLSAGSSAFRQIVADLRNVPSRDIRVFVDSAETHARAVALLARFGVTYKSGALKAMPGEPDGFEEEHEGEVDKDIGRVIAKIALNYFAYCALQEGRVEVLYGREFDPLRAFILRGEGNLQSFVSFDDTPLLQSERDTGKSALAHLLTFAADGHRIVARLTFFGLQVYRVVFGDLPAALVEHRFGCGHAFNPFDGTIRNLVQKAPPYPYADTIRATFGLFKRV